MDPLGPALVGPDLRDRGRVTDHLSETGETIMGNWCGSARSNYVKVKDIAGLKESLQHVDIAIKESDGMYWLCCETDSGRWPTAYSDDDDRELDFDPAQLICPYLDDGQVLVLLEVGADRMRCLTGRAEAYSADGRSVVVDLDRIYREAAEAFSVPQAMISKASY